MRVTHVRTWKKLFEQLNDFRRSTAYSFAISDEYDRATSLQKIMGGAIVSSY